MAEQVDSFEGESEVVEAPKRFGPFKVLAGKYIGADPDNFVKDARGNIKKDTQGNPIPAEIVKDTGSPPFYATCDLLQYNYPGMGDKFALIGGQSSLVQTQNVPNPPKVTDDTADGLDQLTKAELRQYASDQEIDLHGVPDRKEDIINAIRNKNTV